MSDNPLTNDKLIDLETKVAYLEATLDKLNDEVYQQQRTINQLQQTQQMLVERWREQQGDGSVEVADSPPPHY